VQFCDFSGGVARALILRVDDMRYGGQGTRAREEFSMDEDVTGLEPRVARIEGEVVQINSRLADVEVDLRDLRKSMDQKRR
jgi:hypothetical protein